MATKIIKAQITQRHDTRSNWESVNPVLLEGELGLVSDDPNLYKVGDGRTEWNNLPYRGFDGTLVQEEGTSANAAMSQKAVTEALAKMPGTTGTYPSMRVGTADDLAGRGESVPASFGFRASGGKSIKDGRAYLKRIKGNSVVWNQKLRNSRIGNADYWYSQRSNAEFNGQGVHIVATSEFSNLFQDAKLILGHKYLLYASAKGNGYRLNLNLCGQDAQGVYLSDNYAPHYFFIQFNEYLSDMVQLYVIENDADWYVEDCRLIDLTQEFQAGNEPTTIEEFNARVATLGIDMYAYNEGEVIHCNTESIKSVGDNAWDEEWEGGSYDLTTGEPTADSAYIRTKNFIDVLPNERYYIKAANVGRLLYYDQDHSFISASESFGGNWEITTPKNCRYMRYRWEGSAYNNDIMITLVHSGWKQDTDAGYQPYWQDILPLPIINKYFPDGMKKAGTAHDEIRYNKATQKWESVQRIGSVDLGTLDWDSASDGHFYVPSVLGNCGFGNLICAKYTTAAGQFSVMQDDKTIGNNQAEPYNQFIFVRDDAYTDVESFKASLQGVILYYELAEPIVTELDEADQNFRDYYNVADFGTEQSQSSVPSAAFSADIIYQFNAVDMIRENYNEIQKLKANGGNSYDDTEIKKQIASKVDATYVSNAINNALGTIINGDY